MRPCLVSASSTARISPGVLTRKGQAPISLLALDGHGC